MMLHIDMINVKLPDKNIETHALQSKHVHQVKKKN